MSARRIEIAIRRASFSALLVALSACGHVCTDETESGPKVRGPLEAEFVVKRESWLLSGRHAPSVDGVIRIKGRNATDYPADCFEPDRQLQGDDEGSRLAYRCAASEDWRVLYVTPRGTVLSACKTHPSASAQVAWDSVASFAKAAPELAACAPREAIVKLFDELLESDVALTVEVLRATWDEALEPERLTGDDIWLRTFDKLPEAERASLADALLKTAFEPSSRGEHLWRAIVVARPRLDEGRLLAKLEELAASEVPLSNLDDLALSAGARMLVSSQPERVGKAACTALTKAKHADDYREYLARSHLSAVLAKSKVPCPELTSRLGCGEGYACGSAEAGDRRVCTLADILPAIEASFTKDPVALVRGDDAAEETMTDVGLSTLALAYQTDAVPEGFMLQNARLLYAQEPSGPDCYQVETRGAPCRCIPESATLESSLCVPATAKTATGTGCIMEFDDAAHVIRGHQQCEGKLGSYCSKDVECCEGTCQSAHCAAASAGSAEVSANAAPSSSP